MKLRFLASVLLTAAVVRTSTQVRASDDLPPEFIIMSAQPCVYKVNSYGDYTLTRPSELRVNMDYLEKQYEAAKPDVSKIRFCWSRIAAEPDKCLAVGSETTTDANQNALIGGGTCFAISREGIFLTNAHVIADGARGLLPAERPAFIEIIAPALDGYLSSISTRIGGRFEQDQTGEVLNALIQYCAEHSRVESKFRRAELVLKFDHDRSKLLRGKTVEEFLKEKPKPITVPLVVLAKGERMPGKDVAVLKADMVADQREAIQRHDSRFQAAKDSYLIGLQNDKFICLPIFDGELMAGMRVQAMGFPDIAFSADLMEENAEYAVSSQDGQIGQFKNMKGGWRAIEMTADINHGDSGGPVLDSKGRVIGLNVGAARGSESVGHTLAVPIEEALALLKQLNITPDPGPLTAKWIEGLRLYHAEKYEEAKAVFTFISDVQEGIISADGQKRPFGGLDTGGSKLLKVKTNPYVKELDIRCFIKLREKQPASTQP